MEVQKNYWKNKVKEWTTLDKPARLAEVLFGLIMVLTFTGTISASGEGEEGVSELLWAALGCNLAWGLVDAIMYLMDDIISRARSINLFDKVRQTGPGNVSRDIIRDNITPLIADLMNDAEIDNLTEKINQLPVPNLKNTLTFKKYLVAGQIFLLVFLSTFPVALPFIFFDELETAMRVSNGVALLLLFIAGFTLARYSGLRPVLTALIYTGLGVILVVLTILLGG